jgi:tetratricopeptide (TPR) repeat protein
MIDWNLKNDQAKQFFEQKKFKEAICVLQESPTELLPNLAKCYYYNQEAPKALECLEKYRSATRDFSYDLQIDEALYKNAIGLFEEAKEILEILDSIKEDPRVKFNLGWHHLREGSFYRGFCHLIYGSKCRAWGNEYDYIERGFLDPKKSWDGYHSVDKMLFILEGGLGDQIIFYRWNRLLSNFCKDLNIACHPSLVRMFTNNKFDLSTNIIPLEQIGNIEYDVYVPSMNLPSIRDLGIYSPSSNVNFPYITAEFNKYINRNVESLRSSSDKKFVIGFKWFGNPEFEHDQMRTVPEKPLKEIVSKHGQGISLQFEDNDVTFPNAKGIITSWEDTCNLLRSVDITVTSCTSIAHLCGAMDLPCIVLVPLVPYFTWANDNLKWYRSIKIIRQDKYSNWDNAFQKLDNELLNFKKEREL